VPSWPIRWMSTWEMQRGTMKHFGSEFVAALVSSFPAISPPVQVRKVGSPWQKIGMCPACWHYHLLQNQHVGSDDGEWLELHVPAGDMLCMECAAEGRHHHCGRRLIEATYLMEPSDG
jgi:hypothetical protein